MPLVEVENITLLRTADLGKKAMLPYTLRSMAKYSVSFHASNWSKK